MKKQVHKTILTWISVLTAALILLTVWTAWSNTALTVHTVRVSGERIPAGFHGFRIAQISDLHNAEFGANNGKLIQKLSECAPDIIAITGDLVDLSRTDMNVALNFAKEAVRIADTYYVTGNHEAGLPQYDELKKGLENAGVTVLEDAVVPFEYHGEKVTLIGLSDPDFTLKGDLFGEVSAMTEKKIQELTKEGSGYTVLFSHRPELFQTYVNCGIDLVLSGHAHGGQFRLPLFGGLIAPNQGLFPKYDAGLYTEGNTDMVVSRGLGNSIIPVRFNNRPEIVLVEFADENQ